jgi:hypothetical protein
VPGQAPVPVDPDTAARLDRLDSLLAQGLIDTAEHEAKRRELLAAADTAPLASTREGAGVAPDEAIAPTAPATTAERLRQLDAMRAQGLIEEKEYRVQTSRLQAEGARTVAAAAAAPAPPPAPTPAAPAAAPPTDSPEVVFLRLFYNFCMLHIDDPERIRALSQEFGGKPLPEDAMRTYQPAEAVGFDGWAISDAAGRSVLTIHESPWQGGLANVCTMGRAGPSPEALAKEIESRFAIRPLDDRRDGVQRVRQYAVELPRIGKVMVALSQPEDPSRPAVNLSALYLRR